MIKTISIEILTTAEKIELMEKLWTDISALASYSPPDWHGEELASRRGAVKEGKTTYTNWEQAKKEIRYEMIS
ncbi:MAG: addiction module antitoxin RelB [Balneolaceae bacterium]|nr:MAG: addiction module antitoxin RelB [Balneolaceae bacterium]